MKEKSDAFKSVKRSIAALRANKTRKIREASSSYEAKQIASNFDKKIEDAVLSYLSKKKVAICGAIKANITRSGKSSRGWEGRYSRQIFESLASTKAELFTCNTKPMKTVATIFSIRS